MQDDFLRVSVEDLDFYCRHVRSYVCAIISTEAVTKKHFDDSVGDHERDKIFSEFIEQYKEVVVSGIDDDIFGKFLSIGEIKSFIMNTFISDEDGYFIDESKSQIILNFCRNRLYNEEMSLRVKKGLSELCWDGNDFVLRDKHE